MANYSLALRLFPETVRTTAFGAIGAGYTAIGTTFDHPIRVLFVQNLTDKTLMFSFNGVDDHFPLPAMSFLLIDVTANSSVSQGFYIQEGQRIYVKDLGAAPASGAVYVSVFYGQGV